jgi:YidC/Oxa1 family membrane protein insertase
MMDWIYTAISWILLRWHDLWDKILPGSATFLATNWDWILAIVFLVITVRIILFPIFVKQIRSQRAMQALQPKMKELQEKHKGDKETLRQEMMKLYQTEKVNPLMGCLPMFLQIPVFLGLFHVLQRLDPVQTKNTTLYTWTQQQWDSAAVARVFDAPIAARFADGSKQLEILNADGTTVKIVAGVLVLIMMVTTFLTSRQMILKTGWSADPQQRMIQKLMLYGIPFSLLMSGWYFPIGVIVYWVTQNLFSLGQQYWVLHKYPPPVVAGSTPLKAEKETPGTKSLFARFLPQRTAAASGNGFVNPTQRRSGLFRRRPDAQATPASTVAPRSLAPRPGAKPVAQGAKPVPPGAKPVAQKQLGVESAPKPGQGKNANDAVDTAAAANTGDTLPDGATPKPTPKPQRGANSGGTASTGKPAGVRKKTTTVRKGSSRKKGGPRR